MMQRLYHVVTIPDGITDVKLVQLHTATTVRGMRLLVRMRAALADPTVADELCAGWKGS